MKRLKGFISLLLLLIVAACTGPAIRDEYPKPAASCALEPGPDGPLADLEAAFAKPHGSQKSGFLLLENNTAALQWRLALIDEARSSLDVQYYLWYGDDSGSLILKRVLDAAAKQLARSVGR
jgi:putative cardiolipin synthase